jgi:hypothetical protein
MKQFIMQTTILSRGEILIGLKWVFLNLWATDREQTEGVERAVQFRHDHTSGASEF